MIPSKNQHIVITLFDNSTFNKWNYHKTIVKNLFLNISPDEVWQFAIWNTNIFLIWEEQCNCKLNWQSTHQGFKDLYPIISHKDISISYYFSWNLLYKIEFHILFNVYGSNPRRHVRINLGKHLRTGSSCLKSVCRSSGNIVTVLFSCSFHV